MPPTDERICSPHSDQAVQLSDKYRDVFQTLLFQGSRLDAGFQVYLASVLLEHLGRYTNLHCQYNRAALSFRHQAVIEAQTWELAPNPKP